MKIIRAWLRAWFCHDCERVACLAKELAAERDTVAVVHTLRH